MDFETKEPIYLQIAELVMENILQGRWKDGDRIPSIREFAVSVEVNPNTVVRTFSYLQDMDVIYNQRGIGYFVSEGAGKRIKMKKREEFITEEIPHVFRMMELLDIDFKELESLYKKIIREEEK